jgi:hypothetical protein
VATNVHGNVFVTGEASPAVDFDPGSGVHTLSSLSGSFVFVAMYTSSCGFRWVQPVVSDYSIYGRDITADDNNEVTACGAFKGIVEMDPGPAVDTMLGDYSAYFSVCVTRYDSMGNYLWGFGVYQMNTASICTLPSGNICIAGRFIFSSPWPDFDPGPGVVHPPYSIGMFMACYTPAGNYAWSFTNGGVNDASGQYWTVTATQQAIYGSGILTAAQDFDPSTATTTLTPSGNPDAFVARYALSKPTGIAEPGTPGGLFVFPNPASGSVTLNLPGSDPFTVRVHNLAGELVLETMSAQPGAFQLDLQSLPGGAYFITAISDKQSFTEKIILSH